MKKGDIQRSVKELSKVKTGIKGFDEITNGGLPKGRPTLVAGGAGSGKTMFAMEFIVHGAVDHNEPGVYVTFEENIDDLKANFASMGYDLDTLVKEKKMAIDHVFIERSMIEETGEYDLEALFIRMGYAIDSIGAKRVSLDTIEVLFAGLTNHAIIRSEILRLFRWLKERGITAVVTGEKGESSLTRYGLEEYIADCVIFLDNRVEEQLSTRRLRVIKYRGSSHGMDEYPFLISKSGISLFPITSISTDYKITKDRISSGVPGMDKMLGGKGFYRGSTVMVSGTAGTGKSSFAAYFVNEACKRGEKCLYFALEENQDQIIRNMMSIGIDLQKWVDKKLLKFHVTRPALYGLETHLVVMEDEAKKFDPKNVVIDPMTDFVNVGGGKEMKSLLTRLFDLLKSRAVTIFVTDLVRGDIHPEKPETYMSSLIDTWILLRNNESNGERNRGITILKSRGMEHSNQIREFKFTSQGIVLSDPYIGPAGVLMGSAKTAQEIRDNAATMAVQRDIDSKKRLLAEKQKELKAKVEAMKASYKADEEALILSIKLSEHDRSIVEKNSELMASLRKSDKK